MKSCKLLNAVLDLQEFVDHATALKHVFEHAVLFFLELPNVYISRH